MPSIPVDRLDSDLRRLLPGAVVPDENGSREPSVPVFEGVGVLSALPREALDSALRGPLSERGLESAGISGMTRSGGLTPGVTGVVFCAAAIVAAKSA